MQKTRAHAHALRREVALRFLLLAFLTVSILIFVADHVLLAWHIGNVDLVPTRYEAYGSIAELVAVVALWVLGVRARPLHSVIDEDLAALAQHLGDEAQVQKSFGEIRNRIEQVIDSPSLPTMVFQPIVSLTTGEPVGHEALARFPVGPPEAWFEEAADVNLLAELELKAIERALRLGSRMSAKGGTYLSVNCSPSTLLDPRLSSLLSAGERCALVLELTEHLPVEDYVSHKGALERIRRSRGIKLAIDDAGAGYSSLRHIAQLRPEVIKIDRCFVAGLDEDPSKCSVVASMLTLGEAIGASVIAEGVETPAERAALLDLGVEYGQGWLFGRPKSAAQVQVPQARKGDPASRSAR